MTREPNDFNIDKTELQPDVTPEINREISDNTKSNMDERDYDDFIYTRYHGRKRNIFSPQQSHNTTRSYSSQNHFVKEVRVSHKRRKPWWKKLFSKG